MLRILLVFVSAVCLSAAGVSAQDRPQRAYRGLFGGNANDPNSRQTLDFKASLNASYDDNLLAEQNGQDTTAVDPRYQVSGVHSGLSLDLSYTRALSRLSFGLNGATNLRYYPGLTELTKPTYQFSAGMATSLGRAKLRANQGFTYAPYYTLGFLPSLAPDTELEPVRVPSQDYAVLGRVAYGYASAADLSYDLGSRSSMSVGYRRRLTDYVTEGLDLITQSANGGIQFRMTNHMSLHLGYGHTEGSYERPTGRQRFANHDIGAGINYNRALSFSRKTSISFGSGSSIAASENQKYYNVTAAARLNHEIGRSWSARIIYDRSLRFLDGFTEPFFTDAVAASVGGYLSRRIDLTFQAGYATGSHGLTDSDRRYGTYSGTAQFQYALTRLAAFSAQYLYYHYRFDGEFAELRDIPRSMGRHGVRAGLNLSLPLIR